MNGIFSVAAVAERLILTQRVATDESCGPFIFRFVTCALSVTQRVTECCLTSHSDDKGIRIGSVNPASHRCWGKL